MFQNPAAVLHGHYQSGSGESVGVYVGYYRDQRQGRQLVTSVNELTTGEAWSRTAYDLTALGEQRWRRADDGTWQASIPGTMGPRFAWQARIGPGTLSIRGGTKLEFRRDGDTRPERIAIRDLRLKPGNRFWGGAVGEDAAVISTASCDACSFSVTSMPCPASPKRRAS